MAFALTLLRPPAIFAARAVVIAGLVAAVSLFAPPPAASQDLSEMVLRLNRLEGQVRTLSGQVEELTFENNRLRQQLERFQEDVEFRFQESGGASPPPERRSQTPAAPAAPLSPPAVTPLPEIAAPAPIGRGDAFNPDRDPAAPGAPQPLGTTTPSAPLTLPGARFSEAAEGAQAAGGASFPTAQGPISFGDGASATAAAPSRSGPSIAATGDADPRIVYDDAYAFLLAAQYERAEMGFRQFLQSHPRDALAPDARFWLGETYAQRGRHREAAENFLTVSTEFPESRMAPRALLRLGGALAEIGVPDQACATLAEIPRQYPQAAVDMRESIERERARAGCA
ncbi:MAG: tol-pal system protein YbgF [Salinarimonadaceae bacterium]|nr:MAG: tol-pal system protein YbgF [Salinarimonadaceae bacterium]